MGRTLRYAVLVLLLANAAVRCGTQKNPETPSVAVDAVVPSADVESAAPLRMSPPIPTQEQAAEPASKPVQERVEMTTQPQGIPVPVESVVEGTWAETRILSTGISLGALERTYRTLGFSVQSHPKGFNIMSDSSNSFLQALLRPDGRVELLMAPRTAVDPSNAAPEELVTDPANARMVRQRLEQGDTNIRDLLKQ